MRTTCTHCEICGAYIANDPEDIVVFDDAITCQRCANMRVQRKIANRERQAAAQREFDVLVGTIVIGIIAIAMAWAFCKYAI